MAKKDWSDNLQCIPDVKWASFFVYMIDKCGWTTKQVESHEQTKGYTLKVSNHIEKVKVHHLRDYELWYIRAECLRQTSQSRSLTSCGCSSQIVVKYSQQDANALGELIVISK